MRTIKKSLIIISLLAVVIAIPLTVFISQQQQEIRQRASGKEPAVFFAYLGNVDPAPLESISLSSGQQKIIALYLNAGNIPVNGYDIIIDFGAILQSVIVNEVAEGADANKFDSLIFKDFDQATGKIRFAKTNIDPSPIIQGKLHLGSIAFTVKPDVVGTGSIDIAYAEITSPGKDKLTVDLSLLPFTIGSSPTPTPTPTTTLKLTATEPCPNNSITFSWNAISGAEEYYLQQYVPIEGKEDFRFITSVKTGSELSFTYNYPNDSRGKNYKYALYAIIHPDSTSTKTLADSNVDIFIPPACQPTLTPTPGAFDCSSLTNKTISSSVTYECKSSCDYPWTQASWANTSCDNSSQKDNSGNPMDKCCYYTEEPTPTPSSIGAPISTPIPTPTSASVNNVTLVLALNAQDAPIDPGGLYASLDLYNLATNLRVITDARPPQLFDKTPIPGRQYSANISLANLHLDNRYFIVARKANMIAKSVFTVSSANERITVPTATLVFGDVNSDNDINISDYYAKGALKDCYKKSITSNPACGSSDFDNSGIVDQIDYNTYLRGFAAWQKQGQY